MALVAKIEAARMTDHYLMPRSFRQAFHQAVVRARSWMLSANAPGPECNLDGKAPSAGVVFDVMIQFNRDQLSQTDQVLVLKILDGGREATRQTETKPHLASKPSAGPQLPQAPHPYGVRLESRALSLPEPFATFNPVSVEA